MPTIIPIPTPKFIGNPKQIETIHPVKTQPMKPPIKPSKVLLGLMLGTMFRLPMERPTK